MTTVEIYDEDNSIILEDEYSTTDFEFFPVEKKFKLDFSIKDDCYFRDEIYEYKINSYPIEIYIRLLQSSSHPPQEFSVKDGVVLESELLKDKEGFFLESARERILDLKKQVEWSKSEIFGNYAVNLYILSKHSEIISKQEFDKFLRQSAERIKLGVIKIENLIKSGLEDLEIYTSKTGRSISYKSDCFTEKEISEYWELPEIKQKNSRVGKKFEYVEESKKSLFQKGSPRYVGISESEYYLSIAIVEYVDRLLNLPKGTLDLHRHKEVGLSANNTNNKNITTCIYCLSLFFVALKLSDSIDWGWWGVFAPVLIWEGLGFIIGLLRNPVK